MPFTVFNIIALSILMLAVFLSLWLFRRKRRQSYMDDLDLLFSQTWSGREGEELYTWYQIKAEYLEGHNSEKHIRYIDKKINELDKSKMLSGYSVDEFGNIELSTREKKIRFN